MTNIFPLSEAETEALEEQVGTLIGNYGWGNVARALYSEFDNWTTNWHDEGAITPERQKLIDTFDPLIKGFETQGDLFDKLGID